MGTSCHRGKKEEGKIILALFFGTPLDEKKRQLLRVRGRVAVIVRGRDAESHLLDVTSCTAAQRLSSAFQKQALSCSRHKNFQAQRLVSSRDAALGAELRAECVEAVRHPLLNMITRISPASQWSSTHSPGVPPCGCKILASLSSSAASSRNTS